MTGKIKMMLRGILMLLKLPTESRRTKILRPVQPESQPPPEESTPLEEIQDRQAEITRDMMRMVMRQGRQWPQESQPEMCGDIDD